MQNCLQFCKADTASARKDGLCSGPRQKHGCLPPLECGKMPTDGAFPGGAHLLFWLLFGEFRDVGDVKRYNYRSSKGPLWLRDSLISPLILLC